MPSSILNLRSGANAVCTRSRARGKRWPAGHGSKRNLKQFARRSSCVWVLPPRDGVWSRLSSYQRARNFGCARVGASCDVNHSPFGYSTRSRRSAGGGVPAFRRGSDHRKETDNTGPLSQLAVLSQLQRNFSSLTRFRFRSKGRKRSPTSCNRAGIFSRRNSSVSTPRSISSQVTGVETGACGLGRTE